MAKYKIFSVLLILLKGIIDAQVKINEDFLSNWKELKYSKTKTYSKQSVEKIEDNGVLKT
ncbi:MAG: hypothetical protein J7K04_10690 [Spirochaetales bacterium]|nr:hypothetical protein [Spirochaetales bacterium]